MPHGRSSQSLEARDREDRESTGCGDPRRRTPKDGHGRWQQKDSAKWTHVVYTFLETMRWTGLAIGDAMRLRKETLEYDAGKDLYRIKTKRQKTGVPVANPIPHELAENLQFDPHFENKPSDPSLR